MVTCNVDLTIWSTCHSQASNLVFIAKFGRSIIPAGDILHVPLVLFIAVKGKGSIAVILNNTQVSQVPFLVDVLS